MTVFRRRRGKIRDRVYSYDFQFQGARYKGTTHQITREAAEQFERNEKDRVRRRAAGLYVEPRASDTPRFQEWAETAYDVISRRVQNAERAEFLLRAILKFWGAKPEPDSGVKVDEAAPYHDLRLGDVVRDPHWIERFEKWMAKRGLAPQTKNHYRSMTSMLYRIAIEPAWRQETGIITNPMAGVHRDRVVWRKVTVTPAELRAWIDHAPYHVKVAVAIGALVPKLRLRSILDLRWKEHVDLRANRIVVWKHKTAMDTGAPQVWPITPQLRRILLDAQRRAGDSEHVVNYRGKPLKNISGGVNEALKRAGLTPGRAGGVTFHSLRHSAATELVRRHGLARAKDAMGHRSLETTLGYTHLVADDQLEPARALARTYQIADLITGGSSARTVDGRRAYRAKKPPIKANARTPRKPQRKPRSA